MKKSSEVTAIPSIGEVTWVMGLTSLVITAPESSAAIEMVAYLTMTLIASIILRWIEKRMAGKRDYVLVKTGSRNAAAGNYNYPVKGSPLDEHSKEHAQHVHQTHQAQIQHDLKYGRNRGER